MVMKIEARVYFILEIVMIPLIVTVRLLNTKRVVTLYETTRGKQDQFI